MKINCETEKYAAIKALRQFTLDTFGVTAGLKESKDLVDSMLPEVRMQNEIASLVKRLGAWRVQRYLDARPEVFS